MNRCLWIGKIKTKLIEYALRNWVQSFRIKIGERTVWIAMHQNNEKKVSFWWDCDFDNALCFDLSVLEEEKEFKQWLLDQEK